MNLRALRLRSRRLWRRRQIQIEIISQNTGIQFEKNFLGRFNRLKSVWRFTTLWVMLFVLLGGCVVVQLSALKNYYQTVQPVAGGIYTEGIQGSFTTANPIYAVNEVDSSVAKLLFASLLTYNDHNQLVGDLASSWQVNSLGTVYTVNLRPGLTWQDGQPLTAADVLFTYQTIQDPDAQSPLFSSWQNVKVAQLNNLSVSFTLPNPLSSFPYSLTNGIIPKHILGSVNIADLRSVNFNTSDPVGAGPFKWGSIGVSNDPNTPEEQISLLPFDGYWSGMPKLNSFTIDAFASTNALVAAYQNGQVTAIVEPDSLPSTITSNAANIVYNLPLTAGVYVFFKSSDPLFSDLSIRQALVDAANRSAIIQKLGYPAIAVNEPLLNNQLGYNAAYAQITNQPSLAVSKLNADGWLIKSDNFRYKGSTPLAFTLTIPNESEYLTVANTLAAEWKAIGVNVSIMPEQSLDFQSSLSSHQYEAVLYGISIGVDPDVYVYWDSAQANLNSTEPLNFSEYRSDVADAALEAGRTRLSVPIRIIKYQDFLQAWQQDTPALALYQPRLMYVSHVTIYGLGTNQINTDPDRYNNVQNWEIKTGWVTDK
jgi:peptide/nickel transport system substrate-binding protein